jgi:retinoid hydroxylase
VTNAPLPPGRLGLPWIGETMSIARNNHKFYRDHLAKYGPVFKTRLFGVNFVIVSGHEAFHQFATDPRVERGGTDPISVEQMFFQSLALVDGQEHHSRKDVMLHAVRTDEAMAAYLERMQRVWSAHVDQWAEDGSATLRPDLQLASAQLTGALYTGDEAKAHVDELNQILAAMRYSLQILPLPIPGTPYAKALKGRKRLDVLITQAIERHQQHPEEYDDIVSRMLAEAPKHGVPVEKLHGDIRHLIFAGQAGFFVPFILLTMVLGQRPDLRQRAREEVLAVSPEGQVTMEQLARMDYLGQLSKEVRRHFAMNSSTFFGKAVDDLEIGGYHVPKGWGMIGAIHINMRNADNFEDPDTFDPERFSPEREAALAPGSYVPHGDGERNHHRCPGEDMVTIAIKIYLTLLLRKLDWSLPPQDLTLTNELFPLPASGLKVSFTRVAGDIAAYYKEHL